MQQAPKIVGELPPEGLIQVIELFEVRLDNGVEALLLVERATGGNPHQEER
jgi:hypothetical protein